MRVVMHGGRNGANVLSDTRELVYDAQPAWREISAPNAPARYNHAATYDPQRGVVVHGGTNGTGATNETWVLRYGAMASTPERCVDAEASTDGDAYAGCNDPDCWWRCTPVCLPFLR